MNTEHETERKPLKTGADKTSSTNEQNNTLSFSEINQIHFSGKQKDNNTDNVFCTDSSKSTQKLLMDAYDEERTKGSRFRLEEGSRLDITSDQDRKERILKGQDYDFGGEAAAWLRTSAGALKAEQEYIKNHSKGEDKENSAYSQQLKTQLLKVEKHLDKIYGTHDIPHVFTELKEQAEKNSGDMNGALIRLKNQYDSMQSGDARYVAKSARDLAIGYLAEAAHMAEKNNLEESRIMRRAAIGYLGESQKLDPAAPDAKAIEELYLNLEKAGKFQKQ